MKTQNLPQGIASQQSKCFKRVKLWDFQRGEEEFEGKQEIFEKSWQKNMIWVRSFKKNRGGAMELSRIMFGSLCMMF